MSLRTPFTLLVALALVACGSFGGGNADLEGARAAVAAGDYGGAVITLREVVAKSPGDAEAQALLARALRLRGDLPAATEALKGDASRAPAAPLAREAAELQLAQGEYAELLKRLDAPDSPLAAAERDSYRARALMGQGDFVEALAALDALLKAGPEDPDRLVNAARCHAALGRHAEALRLLDRALAARPEGAAAWALRASLQQASDPAGARVAWQKAVDHAPGQLSIPEQLGLLGQQAAQALTQGDLGEAAKAQARLAQLAPQSPQGALLAAQLELARDQPAAAVARMQALVQQAPQFLPAQAALVGALLSADSLEQALQASAALRMQHSESAVTELQDKIKSAASASPGSAVRALRTGVAAVQAGQGVAARRILERALQQHPENKALAVALLRVQLKAGQAAQALEKARVLQRQARNDPNFNVALAEALTATGDLTGATVILDALWTRAPSGPLAVALSQARIGSGSGDALAPLSAWLATHPRDAKVRFALANTAQRLKQEAMAIAEYERLVAQQPDNVVALNNLAGLYGERKDGRAQALAKRAYDRAASSPVVADTYGWLLSESGDPRAALPILRGASRGAPADPDIRYHLAVTLARTGAAGDRQIARHVLADLLADPQFIVDRREALSLARSLE